MLIFFLSLQDNVPYKPPEYGEGLEELDEVYVQVINRILYSLTEKATMQ